MRILLAVFLLAFLAGPAHADAARDALAEIAKCADIAESSERLKCFDSAVPHARSALAAQPEPPAPKKGFLEWFGFSKPQPVQKAEDFGKPPAPPGPEEITQITANVVEFAKTPYGKSIFILDNGQIWRQLDGDSTEVANPAPGKLMRVTVETGMLGSYNLTIEGRNGLVKVRRLQ
jgi:hypothetical protein